MGTCLLVHPGAELFGADRMLLESAIGVKQAGIDCLVALPEDGPLVAALGAEAIEAVTIPLLVLRRALFRPRNWLKLTRSAVVGLWATWRMISRTQPDCIYVSTVTLPQVPLVARLRGIPCITHVHEAEASAPRWVNLALYLPHLASTAVLVNSQFCLSTMKRSLPSLANRAEVVENGVIGPPERPTVPRASLGGVLRVLYLGRLSPRKGPDLIIDAAEELRRRGIDVRVVMAGSAFTGYEWYEAKLRAAVRSAGLREDDTLVGFKESIWPLLDACDVLVVPSRLDESFGNTAVEGILAHRPIVVSDTTGLHEAAAGYPTAQLIRRDDSKELAKALEHLVDDWETFRGMVATSAAMAQARHAPTTYRWRIRQAVARQMVPQSATEV